MDTILLLIPAILFFLIFFSAICTVTQFFSIIMLKGVGINNRIFRVTEVIGIIILPISFLFAFDLNETNDCCTGSAFFAPNNRLGIYLLILLSTISYFYCSYRTKLTTPVFEFLVNCLLVFGIIFNIIMIIHAKHQILFSVAGNFPIILLFIVTIYKNHNLFLIEYKTWDIRSLNAMEQICFNVLSSKGIVKYPVLMALCLPVLLIISALLFVFGQKPDSLIRAFTDTYKHGFSQLDYMCDNVTCGGHYLCSVAANGHKQVVKPKRLGERSGKKIICNRQLLIANAFEEVLEERIPRIHQLIRRYYDKVGDVLRKNHGLFKHKIVSDIVYVAMKPLEWMFLVFLYCVDRKPENRIEQQYMKRRDRKEIEFKQRKIFFDHTL